MSEVNVNINSAAVTAIHEFKSFKGYGTDFYVEAQSSTGTVYLQVVLYDDEARSYCRYIHEGDYVRVTGDLKTKPYRKKDGTEGLSLIIERPVVFAKNAGRNSESQLQLYNPEGNIELFTEPNQTMHAVTASAEKADEEPDCMENSELSDAVEAAHVETTKEQKTAEQSNQPQSNDKKLGLQKFEIDGKIYETYITEDDDRPPEEDYLF